MKSWLADGRLGFFFFFSRILKIIIEIFVYSCLCVFMVAKRIGGAWSLGTVKRRRREKWDSLATLAVISRLDRWNKGSFL